MIISIDAEKAFDKIQHPVTHTKILISIFKRSKKLSSLYFYDK